MSASQQLPEGWVLVSPAGADVIVFEKIISGRARGAVGASTRLTYTSHSQDDR